MLLVPHMTRSVVEMEFLHTSLTSEVVPTLGGDEEVNTDKGHRLVYPTTVPVTVGAGFLDVQLLAVYWSADLTCDTVYVV